MPSWGGSRKKPHAPRMQELVPQSVPMLVPNAVESYVCAGQAQDVGDHEPHAVYEMDNETYQTTTVG